MAYTPTLWANGDIVTSEKLNKIEQGIQGNDTKTSTLMEDFNAMRTATASDVGKALKAKTVTDGKVTEWEFGETGGDSAFFVVEVETNWWSDPPSRTANCTWDELNATTKPILWNGQVAQKYSGMSGGRIAYIIPSTDAMGIVPSAYVVYELVFESTGYTVTQNQYTTSTDMSQATRNLAPPYLTNQTYNVGDLVIYNNTLYQCATAVSAPESFDYTKWNFTTIKDAIASSGGGGVDVYDMYQTDPTTTYFYIDATMTEVQASIAAKNVLFRRIPFGGLGNVILMTGYRIYEDSENDDALTLELIREGNVYDGDTFSTYYHEYKFVEYNGSLRGRVVTNGHEVIEQANLIVTMSKYVDEDTQDVSYYCDVTYADIADAFDVKPVLLAFDDTFDADERTNQFVQMRSFENASNKIEYYAVIDSTLSPSTTTSTFVAYSLNEADEVTKTPLGTVVLTSI